MRDNHSLAVVRKANSLIEASFKLSVNEQKLILMLTTSVKKNDQDFTTYTLSVKEFAKAIGLTDKCNIYQRVEALVTGLQKKVLTVHDTVEIKKVKKERVQNINWLSYSSYIKGEGLIELCFHPKLKPYLLNLKARFTSYKFGEVAQLRSIFSIRIYEFIRQYESLKKRTFKLEELRNIFKIESHQYRPYFNFKTRVILVAQRELTKNSNLTFDFEEIKNGKKVVKIKFIIKQNNPVGIHDILTIENEMENTALTNLLALVPEKYQQQQSMHKLIEQYLLKHDFDYISRNIEYANANSNAIKSVSLNNKKSNYRGYLKKALDKDFGLAYQEDQLIQQEREELLKEQDALKAKLAAEKKKKEKAEQEALKLLEEQKEFAKKHIAHLEPSKLEELEQEAVNAIDEPMQSIIKNKKTGWKTSLKLKMNELVRNRLFPL